jgi:AcrR family transcriptional regulator
LIPEQAGRDVTSKAAPPAAVSEVSGTRERILAAAERLFAERGIAGVSLRTIVTEVGANAAAIHYHFGSKEALIEAVFARRATQIAEARLRWLEAARHGPDRRRRLEGIVRAFLEPGLLGGADTDEGAALFARIRARLVTESGDFARQLLARHFDESSRAFLQALEKTLPHLTAEDIAWRFHCMLGIMVYTMANPGRIQSITEGACDPSELRSALAHLVPIVTEMFLAPSAAPRESRLPQGGR